MLLMWGCHIGHGVYSAGHNDTHPWTDTQIVGMSATLGNGEQVARWLDAAYYCSTFRPIALKQWVAVRAACCTPSHCILFIHYVSLRGVPLSTFPLLTACAAGSSWAG